MTLFTIATLAVAGSAAAAVKPSWTVAQARTALLTTPRIWGADYEQCVLGVPPPGCYREWVINTQQVNMVQPDGPAVMVNGRRTWRRFLVDVSGLNALSGTPLLAAFCLHVGGPVRTTYPYSSYKLTGFFAGPAWNNKFGCAVTPTALKYKGGVDL